MLQKLVRAEIGVAALLLVAGLVIWFQRDSATLLILAGVAAFLAVGHYLKAKENLQQADYLEAGLKGEVEVARLLADGLDNDYYVYNDIRIRSGFRSAQVDHVVVGPCGVVLIETKNWRGRMVGDVQDKAWQQYRFSDSLPRRVGNPVLQNQRHAEVVTAYLRSSGLPEVPVIPLLVFTARKATLEITHLNTAIVWPTEMCDHIRRLPRATTFDEPAQDAVLNRFQRFMK